MNTEQINTTILNFRPELLTAFYKMVKGISVRLSDTGKEETKGMTGAWWAIIAINEDETVQICSNTHSLYQNAKLSWLDLN